jgi:hypothetical protein
VLVLGYAICSAVDLLIFAADDVVAAGWLGCSHWLTEMRYVGR